MKYILELKWDLELRERSAAGLEKMAYVAISFGLNIVHVYR